MAYVKEKKISWNKDYVKSVKKDDFIKAHDHLKDFTDLGKVWESHQEKTK